MENPRIVGHVVSVYGFRVKVEILKETRSPSRATLDGVQTAVAINSYLTFSIGAGRTVIGIVTDLEARESYDPSSGDELSLELLKARRVVAVQLLGTVERIGKNWLFNPGITVLPTLDTAAEIGSPEVMAALFERPPKKNKPDNYDEDDNDFDYDLVLGFPTGQKGNKVKASYNDLFSRPLAVVGNTGSGKSYSVVSMLQKAMHKDVLGESTKNAPHIFILDINGEYARAFPSKNTDKNTREPNHIYLNGKEFGIPLWFFNSQEICTWLSAAEQTQEPVLKDWWSVVKSRSIGNPDTEVSNNLRIALAKIENLVKALDGTGSIKKNCCTLFNIATRYFDNHHLFDGFKDLKEALKYHQGELTAQKASWDSPENDKDIREAGQKLIISIKTKISTLIEEEVSSTADSPLLISKANLIDPTLIERAVSQEDAGKIESHLTTLKLRLKTRLDDKRWKAFLNYEANDTKFTTLEDWLQRFGFKDSPSNRVSVIDLSMLSHEALPYACAVMGRILLEARERLPANKRYENPWVLVLEEAHNYARPVRQLEDRGQGLSRNSFEQIAKEGRKFGLSLIVASQRPSEISPTIISQCANFISHRLQNPDDIDHFRRIIPMQARRLLDQVTVLASGEAIVFGSAFHIPTRVQIDIPDPPPWSQTAAPYYEWRKDDDAGFPLDEVMKNWGLNDQQNEESDARSDGETDAQPDDEPGAQSDGEPGTQSDHNLPF